MQKIITLSILIVIAFWSGCARPLLKIDTTSPGKKYRVRLTETHNSVSEKDPWPYKVFMDADRNGQRFLQNEILDHYDDWDVGLAQIATASVWLEENILRLGDREMRVNQQYDWIKIINNSNKIIIYAKMLGIVSVPGEEFLIFDLKPTEEIHLKILAQTDKRSDYSSINFFGKFENQNETSISAGRRFRVKGTYKSPSHYFISVNDNSVEIKSQEYDPVN